jgi:histone H3
MTTPPQEQQQQQQQARERAKTLPESIYMHCAGQKKGNTMATDTTTTINTPQTHVFPLAPLAGPPPPSATGKKKRGVGRPAIKRRWRPGTVAKREIRKLEKTTNRQFPKAPFLRLLRELADKRHPDLNWRRGAWDALQEAAESYVTNIFKKSDNIRQFKGRKTLEVEDLRYTVQSEDLMPGQEPKPWLDS